MKKKVVLCMALITAMLMLLSGCYGSDIRDYIPGTWDPHKGERPTDYPSTKWVSQSPELWFEVPDEDSDAAPKGQIRIDDQTTELFVYFNGFKTAFFSKADGSGLLFSGTCQFGSKKLVVTIDPEYDTLLDGRYKKLTFQRKAAG